MEHFFGRLALMQWASTKHGSSQMQRTDALLRMLLLEPSLKNGISENSHPMGRQQGVGRRQVKET